MTLDIWFFSNFIFCRNNAKKGYPEMNNNRVGKKPFSVELVLILYTFLTDSTSLKWIVGSTVKSRKNKFWEVLNDNKNNMG
jgi:hypothetical protein